MNAAELAAHTDGFSGADIHAVCHKAALHAVRRAVEAEKLKPDVRASVTIGPEDLTNALREVHP